MKSPFERNPTSRLMGGVLTCMLHKMEPPKVHHGQVRVMNFHKQLVDDLRHLGVGHSSVENRSATQSLDVHLHHDSVSGREA